MPIHKRFLPHLRARELTFLLMLLIRSGTICAQEGLLRSSAGIDEPSQQQLTSMQCHELPDAPQPQLIKQVLAYEPITGKQRIWWTLVGTFGPKSMMKGVFSAGLGTASNSPEEYGPHWDGFAKRYGMRLTGVLTSHVMEAGIGAIWGEDPRYVRATGKPFGDRVKNIFWMSVMAPRRDGHLAPAYARFIAYPGNNFLSNTWRVSSSATTQKAMERTGFAFLSKIESNTLAEFWPDVKRYVFNKK